MATVFDPLRLGAVAMDVMAASQGSAQALLARQQTRLKSLVAGAVRSSAYYRTHLQNAIQGDWQLSDLPVVQKKDLMAHFDDWVTDTALCWSTVRTFMADSKRIAEPLLGKYLVWESSGSSHEPGIFIQDAQSLAVYDALEALRCSRPRPLLRWLDPLFLTEHIAFVGAVDGHFSSYVSMQRMRQINPFMARRLRCFSILQPFNQLLEALNRFEPTVIATYPSVAAVLADAFKQGQLRSSPKEVWLGGESLSVAVRRHLEQTFACYVRNNYGASEFMAIGWECSAGNMHANTDWLILEPVDECGKLVPPGLRSHTTLLTHLANQVQPLIRYDLGDQITLQTQPCTCGSHFPVIQVSGRKDETLMMLADNGAEVALLPMALTTVLEEEAGVFDFQIEQMNAATLRINLPMTVANSSVIREKSAIALKKMAAHLGLPFIRVETQTVEALSRGASGKAQRVVALQKE